VNRLAHFSENDRAFADLTIESYSDKGEWVMRHAEKHPDKFGNSIVFTPLVLHFDHDGNEVPEYVYKDKDGNEHISIRQFKIAELHACDLVDEPAATDGLFSQHDIKKSFARYATQFFDTNTTIKRWAKARHEDGTLSAVITDFANKYFETQAHDVKPESKKHKMKPVQLSAKAIAALKRTGKYFAEINITTTDGLELIITATDDTPAVSNPIKDAEGANAPDDVHVVAGGDFDGAVITTVSGVITEYTPDAPDAAMKEGEEAVPTGDTPVSQSELTAIKTELTAIKTEFAALRKQLAAGPKHTPDVRGADGGKKPAELTVTERIELARKSK
jgi:hypothetical protein